MFVKTISKLMPDEFLGASRFDDALKAEWHIISTGHPDHIGDIMEFPPIYPPSGKAIALLNHNEYFTGGLPLGKVLAYQIAQGDDGIAQLWQRTQYLSNLPDDIGGKCYEVRKLKAFTDSSIQFRPEEGGFKPVDDADQGKSQWEWSGTRYLAGKWNLLEAGPVLIGMNSMTGDMKTARKKMMDTFVKCLKDGPEYIKALDTKICTGCGTCNKESTPVTTGNAGGQDRLILTINEPTLTIKD